MIRPRTLRSTTALLACLAGGVAAAPDPEIALPGVSCALLQEPAGTPPPVSSAADPVAAGPPAIRLIGGLDNPVAPTRAGVQRVALRTSAPPATLELGPRNLTVTPGTTVLVEVAIGHLNRLVTPFANPVVHTVSSASTSVDGRVVYVATGGEEPIALWITDGQDGERALSLTLAPRHVPPREIRVTVPGYRPQGGTSTADAPSARSASAVGGDGFGAASYVEGLTDLLRAMAQQRLPPGFQVGQAPFKAHCAAHLKVNKTQLTAGPSASVLTLGVRNSGQDPIAITASVCDVEQQVVAAVAAWPLKTVGPGQETEVFLVLHGAGVAASGHPQ